MLSMNNNQSKQHKDLNYLVVGLGVTGFSVAKYLLAHGYRCRVQDTRDISPFLCFLYFKRLFSFGWRKVFFRHPPIDIGPSPPWGAFRVIVIPFPGFRYAAQFSTAPLCCTLGYIPARQLGVKPQLIATIRHLGIRH